MKTLLNALRWFTGTILVFVLFIVLLVGIPVKAIVDITSEEDSIKGYLSDGKIYERIQEGFGEQIIITLKNNNRTQELERLGEENVIPYVQEVAPVSWLQEQNEKFIDEYFKWFRGDIPEPNFTIDLNPLKERIEIIINKTQNQNDPILNRYLNNFQEESTLIINSEFLDISPEALETTPKIYQWTLVISSFFYLVAIIGIFLLTFIIPHRPGRYFISGGLLLIVAIIVFSQLNSLWMFFENAVLSETGVQSSSDGSEVVAFSNTFKEAVLLFLNDLKIHIIVPSVALLITGLGFFGWGIYELNKKETA